MLSFTRIRMAIAALIGMTALWSGQPAEAQGAKDKAGAANAKMTIQLDALYMRRQSLESVDYLSNNAGTVNVPGDDTTLRDSGDLTGEWEPGGRLAVTIYQSDRWGLEGAGFWLRPFHESESVTDPTNSLEVIPTPNITSAFDGADFVRGTYDSSIWGAAMNLKNHYQPFLTWIGGVRYIDLSEGFDIKAFDGTSPSEGLYDIDTRNRLLGVQSGISGTLPLGPGLTLSLSGLGGAFANQSHQRQIVIDTLNATPALVRYERDGNLGLAWMGEGRIAFDLELNPYFIVGIGYQALYLGNVATAPIQADFVGGVGGGNRIDNGGHVLYHGGRAYLLWRF